MSLEAPRPVAVPGASCPCPSWGPARGARLAPHSLQGAGQAALQTWKPFHEAVKAAGPSDWSQPCWGKHWLSKKGPAAEVPWEQQALTQFLCTANTFTTLELPEGSMPCASSSLLKSLLYLYAKITNTSSVMAIFTHILYFTAVQKKCAIRVNTLCFLKSLL